MKENTNRCDTFLPDCGVRPLLRGEGGDTAWVSAALSSPNTEILCDNSMSIEVLAELTVVGYDSLWVNTISTALF